MRKWKNLIAHLIKLYSQISSWNSIWIYLWILCIWTLKFTTPTCRSSWVSSTYNLFSVLFYTWKHSTWVIIIILSLSIWFKVSLVIRILLIIHWRSWVWKLSLLYLTVHLRFWVWKLSLLLFTSHFVKDLILFLWI